MAQGCTSKDVTGQQGFCRASMLLDQQQQLERASMLRGMSLHLAVAACLPLVKAQHDDVVHAPSLLQRAWKESHFHAEARCASAPGSGQRVIKHMRKQGTCIINWEAPMPAKHSMDMRHSTAHVKSCQITGVLVPCHLTCVLALC